MVSVQGKNNGIMSASQENTNCSSGFGDKTLSLKGSESEIFQILTSKHYFKLSTYALTAETSYP